MIYVKSGLQISPLDISRFSEEVHCEVCGIRVTTQNHILYNGLEYCSARTDVMFLCGDLNVNYLDSCSNDRKLLSDLLGCFNLTVSSLLPTRVFLNSVGKTTSAKLDYVLTNAERDQFEVEVVEANLSDHKIIKLDLLSVFLLPLPISSPLKSVRIINDSSLNSFVTMLASTDFAALYSNSDIDIIFKIFSDLLQSAMYECIPLKNVRVNKNCNNAWITNEIRQARIDFPAKSKVYLTDSHVTRAIASSSARIISASEAIHPQPTIYEERGRTTDVRQPLPCGLERRRDLLRYLNTLRAHIGQDRVNEFIQIWQDDSSVRGIRLFLIQIDPANRIKRNTIVLDPYLQRRVGISD
ncbi:hypothetical protein WA026_013002 [Henosepilachna vigintioctopunctata]|uniref:Uncharacterized protein n=1 Tax=Henosepilachna vigintioctopunctata TaxID=420089 RepID=A0AAW1TV68_9CUCU